ncbi:CHAT domain-containing protein [Kalaharituber pfeilii]|nr:CHAT domain-containing protein [Kalaharituber pfeilii]
MAPSIAGVQDATSHLSQCYILKSESEGYENASDLDKGIEMAENCRHSLPENPADKGHFLHYLSRAYILKYKRDERQEYAGKALTYAQEAVHSTGGKLTWTVETLWEALKCSCKEMPERNEAVIKNSLESIGKAIGARSHSLGMFFQKLCGGKGGLSLLDFKLDERVHLLGAASAKGSQLGNPDANSYSLMLLRDAMMLIERYRTSKATADLDNAERMLQLITQSGKEPRFKEILNYTFGCLFEQRFLRSNQLGDAERGVWSLVQAERFAEEPMEKRFHRNRALRLIYNVYVYLGGTLLNVTSGGEEYFQIGLLISKYVITCFSQESQAATAQTESFNQFTLDYGTMLGSCLDKFGLEGVCANIDCGAILESFLDQIGLEEVYSEQVSIRDLLERIRKELKQFSGDSKIKSSHTKERTEDFMKLDFERLFQDESLSIDSRIKIAATGSSIYIDNQKYSEAFTLLSAAVELIPLLNCRSMPTDDVEHLISTLDVAANDIVALALQVGKPAYDALTYMERTRGLIISHIMDVRSDLSHLREINADLAARMEEVQSRIIQLDVGRGKMKEFAWVEHEDQNTAFDEMDHLCQEIRALPGLSNFMLPPTEQALQAAAQLGPVVVLNAATFRSDALLITKDGVRNIQLQDLRWDDIVKNMSVMASAVSMSDPGQRAKCNKKLKQFLKWLWDTAVKPVLMNLNFQKISDPEFSSDPKASTPPRIWWVSSGILSNLPLHAAGDYGRKFSSQTEAAINYCVSSYTPTVKTLLHSRQLQSSYRPPIICAKLLILAMTITPGYPSLESVKDESKKIREQFNGKGIKIDDNKIMLQVEDSIAPTIHTAKSKIADSDIIHFACHGISAPRSPMDSHLLVMNESGNDVDRLTVRDILRSRHLHSAKLAYLSACSSAHISSRKLLDEGIHMASALQLAGFQHVIGTLWETDDEMSNNIALGFYKALFSREDPLKDSNIAKALHEAVKAELMENNGNEDEKMCVGRGGENSTDGYGYEGRVRGSSGTPSSQHHSDSQAAVVGEKPAVREGNPKTADLEVVMELVKRGTQEGGTEMQFIYG